MSKDIGMILDIISPNSTWSKQDRLEFMILEGDNLTIRNYDSFFQGYKDYKLTSSTQMAIEDLHEKLAEERREKEYWG